MAKTGRDIRTAAGAAPQSLDTVEFSDPRQSLRADVAAEILGSKDIDGHYRKMAVFEPAPDGDYTGKIHVGNPHTGCRIVKSFPTRAAEEEVAKINRNTIWLPETCEIVDFMLLAYEPRLLTFIEGGTAIGKTFCTNVVSQLLFGEGREAILFHCAGQQDDSNLMAGYRPAVGSDPAAQRAWEKFLESDTGKQAVSAVYNQAGAMSDVDPKLRAQFAQSGILALAKQFGLASERNWTVGLGAFPLAMIARCNPEGGFLFEEQNGRGGHGALLCIDEVGTAEPGKVTNSLLKVRGKNRQVARSLHIYQTQKTYYAGRDFGAIMLTNPPEGAGYQEREPIDLALVRAAAYKRIDDLADTSYLTAAEHFLRFKVGNLPEFIPSDAFRFDRHPELTRVLAQVAGHFHLEYREKLKTAERDREQKIPATMDDISTVAGQMLLTQAYDAGGKPDMVETLKLAVSHMYLARHQDAFRAEMLTHLDSLLTDKTTGTVTHGGRKMLRAELIKQLTQRACQSPIQLGISADRELKSAVQDAAGDPAMADLLKGLGIG